MKFNIFFLRGIIVENSEIENLKCAHYGETFTFFSYAARLVLTDMNNRVEHQKQNQSAIEKRPFGGKRQNQAEHQKLIQVADVQL